MTRMKKYVVTPVNSPRVPADSGKRSDEDGIVNPSFLENEMTPSRSIAFSNASNEICLQPSELELSSFTYENVEDNSSYNIIRNNYYEEINFKTGRKGSSDMESVVDGSSSRTADEYEEVVVKNDLPKYSYNKKNGKALGSRGSSASSSSSRRSNQQQFEGVFGMARRLRGSSKKSKKKQQNQQQQGEDGEEFPRSSGTPIALTFGSLEELYSKPDKTNQQKKSNTIVPVQSLYLRDMGRQSDPAAIVDDSGSCVRPVNALYAKSASLHSIRESIMERLTGSVNSLRRNEIPPVAIATPAATEGGDGKKTSRRFKECCCCCFGSQRRREYQENHIHVENDSEPQRQRRKCFLSTSFLCGLIALSLIVVIVAGAVLLHHFLSGDVITVHAGDATADKNTTQQQQQQQQQKRQMLQTGQEIQLETQSRPPSLPAKPVEEFPGWASWSPWSKCSEQCLKGESQARTRACLDDQGNTLNDLKTCIKEGGLNVEIRLCLCNQSAGWKERSEKSVRFCDDCATDEVCLAFAQDFLPTCRPVKDPKDPTGCAGHCKLQEQICHRLDKDAFRCQSARERRGARLFSSGQCFPAGEFECLDGSCVKIGKICDGISDCEFGEDEMQCDSSTIRPAAGLRRENRTSANYRKLCPRNELLCDDGSKCLKPEQICNGKIDCPDRSDEPEGCL